MFIKLTHDSTNPHNNIQDMDEEYFLDPKRCPKCDGWINASVTPVNQFEILFTLRMRISLINRIRHYLKRTLLQNREWFDSKKQINICCEIDSLSASRHSSAIYRRSRI